MGGRLKGRRDLGKGKKKDREERKQKKKSYVKEGNEHNSTLALHNQDVSTRLLEES